MNGESHGLALIVVCLIRNLGDSVLDDEAVVPGVVPSLTSRLCSTWATSPRVMNPVGERSDRLSPWSRPPYSARPALAPWVGSFGQAPVPVDEAAGIEAGRCPAQRDAVGRADRDVVIGEEIGRPTHLHVGKGTSIGFGDGVAAGEYDHLRELLPLHRIARTEVTVGVAIGDAAVCRMLNQP
jgi:hypothetical protein